MPSDPVRPTYRRYFTVPWTALLATLVSLAGYAICSYYEASNNVLVGVGLLLAFAGFLGVSLAMILDSDEEKA